MKLRNYNRDSHHLASYDLDHSNVIGKKNVHIKELCGSDIVATVIINGYNYKMEIDSYIPGYQ